MTSPESQDWQPFFSPDGRKILYRSEREGGGLYVRDAVAGPGGAEMKVVDGGELPSDSPDGTTVAYLVPDALNSQAEIFVVPAGGGTPRRLQPNMVATTPAAGGHQGPLWSPDGASLLVHGGPSAVGATPGGSCPSPAARPRRSRGFPRGRPGSGASRSPGVASTSTTWRGNRSTVRPCTGCASCHGPGGRQWPREARLVRRGVRERVHVGTRSDGPRVARADPTWSVRQAVRGGGDRGPLEAVTADSTGKRSLSVAADGSRLAYASYGPPGQANVEVHVRDRPAGGSR